MYAALKLYSGSLPRVRGFEELLIETKLVNLRLPRVRGFEVSYLAIHYLHLRLPRVRGFEEQEVESRVLQKMFAACTRL